MAKYASDGAPLHDPCVIAYLLRPALFSGRYINVEIEIRSFRVKVYTKWRSRIWIRSLVFIIIYLNQ